MEKYIEGEFTVTKTSGGAIIRERTQAESDKLGGAELRDFGAVLTDEAKRELYAMAKKMLVILGDPEK